MKINRFIGTLGVGLVMAIAPARATEQSSFVIPDAGPHSMADMVDNYFNPALRALASCSWGPSAPANGPGAAAFPYQCWANTTTNPIVLSFYDGTSWVVYGKINTSSHNWTPSYQGTDLGTASTASTGTSGHALGFLDGINTISAAWSFNSGDLKLNGSSSGAGTLNAPAAASTFVWTLPAATDTLVGRATTDTLTNKTFVCANQTSCVVRLGSDVTGILGGANGGTGVNNGSNTITLGGNLSTTAAVTFGNAFATTFTTTATTNSTLPAGTHTLAGLDVAQTFSAAQSFNSGDFKLNGSGSGTLTINAAAAAGTSTLTFPGASFDFSASGGAGQYVKQLTSGAAFSVATIAAGDLPLATTGAFGAIKPDGTTITISSGIITAVSAAATSVDTGGATTTISNGAADTVVVQSHTGNFLSHASIASLLTAGTGIAVSGTTNATIATSLSNLTNSLGSNVTLNSTSTYFDGPSVAQGTSGTWLVEGQLVVADSSTGNAIFDAKLWDGTTVIASIVVQGSAALNAATVIPLSGIITNPAGNLRISVKDQSATSGSIFANASGNGKDSTITAVRIQ